MKYLIPILTIIIIALGTIVPSVPVSAADPKIQEAPPRIVQPGEQSPVVDGHGTGFKPTNKNLPHLNSPKAVKITRPEVQQFLTKKSNVGSSSGLVGTGGTATPIIEVESTSGLVSLPLRFDWRETGKVTPVKNQGSCGSCWAFAAIADFESKILINNGGTYDLSENSAKECTFQTLYCATGGSYDYDVNLFSQKGTVLESCDPYVAGDVACKGDCQYQKTLLDWRIISDDAVPATEALKTYIMNYGPVYTTLYSGFTGFGTYDGSSTLYYAGTNEVTHAVLIVGWDDSLVHAGGTGGWICKNSWGTTWGGTCGYGSERGYFTIAYGSASIGKHSSFLHSYQDYDPNGSLLYYDDGGWTRSRGYPGSTTAWGLAKYIPSSNTNITRVEFWTTDITTDVDVYIYDNFDGSTCSTLLTQKLNLSYENAGYHSVLLDAPLAITAGNDINIVVKFTNSTWAYPLACDSSTPIQSGHTYMSLTGTSGSWTELGAYSRDVAIRVRGIIEPPPAPALVSPANGATIAGTSVTFQWNASAGAVGYVMEINRSPSWTPGTAFFTRQWVGNVTTLTVSGFPNDGTTYYWRVWAGNYAGWSSDTEANTNSRNFLNGTTPPPAPALVSPANGATIAGTSVTFQWNASAGAVGYVMEINRSPSWTPETAFFTRQWVGNVTTLTVSGFPNDGTTYYWRVWAGNYAGWSSDTEANTNSRNFLNGTTPPPAPALVSPANGATIAGTSVTFQWNASAGAVGYVMEINRSPSWTPGTAFFTRQWVGNVTTLTVSGFPNDGTTYYWRVWAGNYAGWSSDTEANTNSRNFLNGTTPPPAPALVSPANGATIAGTSVTFQWNASAGAVGYVMEINRSPSWTPETAFFTRQWVGNVTTLTVSGFPNDGTTYYWRVWAGNYAGWSSDTEANTNSRNFINRQ